MHAHVCLQSKEYDHGGTDPTPPTENRQVCQFTIMLSPDVYCVVPRRMTCTCHCYACMVII